MKYANIIGQTQDEMHEDSLIRLNDLKSRMLNHAIDYGNVLYPAQRLEENINNEEIIELLEQVVDKARDYFEALRQFELYSTNYIKSDK